MLACASFNNQNRNDQAAQKADRLITEAKATVPTISVDELEALIGSGEEFGLIDIRSEEEFEAGFIYESDLIVRSILEFAVRDGALGADDRKLVIYCRSGNRSALAMKTLMELGFTDVRHLDGGYQAWEGAGKPCFNRDGEINVSDSE